MTNKNVQRFRIINTTEGYSYLILLFVGMPLKYIFEIDVAVKLTGMTHGVLFIALMITMIPAYMEGKWKFKCNLLFFVAALIPFGTFYTSEKIKAYE